MSQLNLIIGPAQLQEYDAEKEQEEERERKKRLLKALEDRFKVGKATPLTETCKPNPFNINVASLLFVQSECEQRGESYWYSVTASVVTRIVENIEVGN